MSTDVGQKRFCSQGQTLVKVLSQHVTIRSEQNMNKYDICANTRTVRVLVDVTQGRDQCRQEGTEVGTNYRGPEGGPGPDYVACVFVFLGSIIIRRLYKLILSDQARVTLQLRVTLSDLV